MHLMFSIRSLIVVSVIFLIVEPSFAAGTTSAVLLRLGFGARATALGDAFTSRADDASAVYWNPAGLASLPTRELLAEHDVYLEDVSINRLAYAHPLGAAGSGPRRAIGASFSYLSFSGIEARSGNTAQPDGTFGASDLFGTISYAHSLSESLSVGASAKFIQQRLGVYHAEGYAADLGVIQRFGRWRWGAVVANLGPAMKFVDSSYSLPWSVRGGAAYTTGPACWSAEAELLKGEDPIYRMGVEYLFGGALALRGGYSSRSGATQHALKGGALGSIDGGAAALLGLTAGFGLRLASYSVDYAFAPYGELGNVHKISFTARF